MKTTMYRDERICHLEKYAENMPIYGIYNGKPYSHILKIDRFNKRQIVSCYNIIQGVSSDLLPLSLHRFAHHLNSSQILCYNFFRPMLTESGRATEKLVTLLEKYGIKQSDDIETIISKIEKFKYKTKEKNLEYLSYCELLIAALVPSIAPGADDDIARVSEHLRSNPALLTSQAMEEDIKKCILKRVRLDQNEIKQKISALDEILNNLNKQIQDFANTLLDNGSSLDSAIFFFFFITSYDEYNAI